MAVGAGCKGALFKAENILRESLADREEMNIEKLIHDLRARINPQYYDQLGTESHERYRW